MRLASRRSEQKTVMAIVPISPKPFSQVTHNSHICILPEERMREYDCFMTLLPGLDVVSKVSGASVVFRVSADSSVEVPASENMYL